MPSLSKWILPLAFVAGMFLAGSEAAAQTLAGGLDDPDLAGPVTTEAVAFFSNAPVPSGLWRHDTVDFQVGGDSVASTLPRGAISRLETAVQGPAVVTYRWKTAGDDITDSLAFRVEDQRGQLSLRGDRDWQTATAQVDCGVRKLLWEYERKPSVPADQGTARVDGLVVTPIPNNPALQGAVETFLYSLHSTDWASTALDGALNSTAAKSGPVAAGGSSSMVLEVQGPAAVTFDWAVATDPDDSSALIFLVDDLEEAFLMGNTMLERKSFELGPGWHSLKFLYVRSDDGSEHYEGLSEGYVDRLMIEAYGADSDLAAALERSGGVYSQAWTKTAEGTADGVDAAMATAPEAGVLRRLYVELPDAAGLLSFWARLDTAANQSAYAVRVDGKNLFQANAAAGWRKYEANLGPGSKRVLQAAFLRNEGADVATTRAYLDQVTFTPGANNFQADLSVAPKGQALRGVAVRNLTGAGQTAMVRAKTRRALGKFSIGFRNGSPSEEDRISARGTGNRRHFDILFVVKEGGKQLNYSAAFFSGRFRTLNLGPNATERHEIWVVRKAKSKRRSHTLKALGRSSEAPSKTDAVVTRLRVGGR